MIRTRLKVCGINQIIKIYMPPDERSIWDPDNGLVSLKVRRLGGSVGM